MRGRILGATAVGAVLLLMLGACSGDDDSAGGSSGTATTAGQPAQPLPIGVVQEFDVASNFHVTDVVQYPQTPPVGGDHAGVWQNCGFYDKPIYSETGVHSMEHSAVWITFRPDLPADQIDQIRALAEEPYTLASPWGEGELGAPIVLSAWGVQLAIDSLPSDQATEFLSTYREALTAPEPSFPCTGGTSQTK